MCRQQNLSLHAPHPHSPHIDRVWLHVGGGGQLQSVAIPGGWSFRAWAAAATVLWSVQVCCEMFEGRPRRFSVVSNTLPKFCLWIPHKSVVVIEKGRLLHNFQCEV